MVTEKEEKENKLQYQKLTQKLTPEVKKINENKNMFSYNNKCKSLGEMKPFWKLLQYPDHHYKEDKHLVNIPEFLKNEPFFRDKSEKAVSIIMIIMFKL